MSFRNVQTIKGENSIKSLLRVTPINTLLSYWKVIEEHPSSPEDEVIVFIVTTKRGALNIFSPGARVTYAPILQVSHWLLCVNACSNIT